jgi:hypothetical protein
MEQPAGVPYRDDDGMLVWHGAPTWAQEMAALGEAAGRFRRNNARPERVSVSAEAERAALRREVWQEVLDELGPPGGVEHEDDWQRLTHADLTRMSPAELTDERARLRLRLMLDPDSGPWFIARLAAIEKARHAAR